MSRSSKKILATTILGGTILFLTSCNFTKPFCTPTDKAQQLYTIYTRDVLKSEQIDDVYVPVQTEDAAFSNGNKVTFSDSFKESMKTNKLLLPSDDYINFLDDKVDEFVSDTNNYDQSILSIIDSELSLKPTVQTNIKRSIALFGGYDSDPTNVELWKNFDSWTKEYIDNATDTTNLPSQGFIDYFKANLTQQSSLIQTCLTPEGGMFNHNTTYVEGKTWGQAFTEFGFFEGLFVYPIGTMLHYITKGLGATNGVGQFFGILFTTLIVRLILVVFSFFSMKSQNKMTELQPQLAALNQKYPNSENDNEQKRALQMATMALYKENGVKMWQQFLVLFIQFPLFIFVWAALSGSSILTNGTIFGLSLTTTISSAIMGWTSETPFAIILFLMLCVSQLLSMKVSQWFQTWQTDKILKVSVQSESQSKQQKTMKMVSWVMVVVMCFFGWSLVSAMALYWIFGAWIMIAQTLVMQALNTRKRHKGFNNGDGSSLAQERRSKKHKEEKSKVASLRSSR